MVLKNMKNNVNSSDTQTKVDSTASVQKSAAKELWNEIKTKGINVFAMEATVEDYCKFMDIDDSKCYIACKATAVLPALEATLGPKFQCTVVEKYVLVEKV